MHVPTLIPDYEFISKKELTTNYFLHSGEKNDYSGMAIYSLPLTDRVVRIDLYKDGQKIESYGFLGVDEKDEMESEIIDDILLNISFLTQKIEKTRSSNEGGSGGGGVLPPDPTDTDMPDGMQYKDDASKEKLSEDYKEFAKSIFGSKLLELLSQNLGAGKWQITIIHYDYILGLCRTNINTKEISIYLDESEIHWPAPWAEELFHAYQETNVPHRYIENGEMIFLNGNLEIESHMMQIIHNQYAGPGCAGNKGRWIPYNDFINNPTEENFNKVVDAMRKDYYDIDPQGKEFLYDYTRFHRANLDSLIKILPPPPPPKE